MLIVQADFQSTCTFYCLTCLTSWLIDNKIWFWIAILLNILVVQNFHMQAEEGSAHSIVYMFHFLTDRRSNLILNSNPFKHTCCTKVSNASRRGVSTSLKFEFEISAFPLFNHLKKYNYMIKHCARHWFLSLYFLSMN